MDHNYDDIIILERYLERSLNQEEAREVEKRLAEEPDFRELYQNEKLLVDGIRYGHLKTQLEELKNLEASLPSIAQPERTGRVIQFKTYWRSVAAAASVMLLIASFLLWNRPADPVELYAEYYTPYPNIFKGITRGTQEGNLQSETYAYYEKGDYAKAVEGFNKILKDKESLEPRDRPGILLLLGNSNLMLGKTEDARNNFITLSKDSDELDEQAQWFLSLCYLKMGNKDSAKVLFEEIAGGNSSYKEKARELLKKMK